MTRVNDSCCELKSVFLTTESGQICQLTRIIKSPIPESDSALLFWPLTYLRLNQRAQPVVGAEEGQKVGKHLRVFVLAAVQRHQHVALASLLRRQRLEVPPGRVHVVLHA